MVDIGGGYLFLRCIVEVFIVNFMIYTLSKRSINNTSYYIVSILLSLLTYVVRLLPIYCGVHIVINLITFISIMTILGIPLIKSIKNTLITFTILEFSEILNLIILIILRYIHRKRFKKWCYNRKRSSRINGSLRNEVKIS